MADITHVVGEEGNDYGKLEPYSNNPHDYYKRLKEELGEELVEKLNPILDDLTVDQLRCLERYIGECCRAMSREMEKTVTMADFEAVKHVDIDADNEEGESDENENENEAEEY